MEQLLLLTRDSAILPTITDLVARSQEVPSYLCEESQLTLAFFHYRAGQLPEAKKSIDGFFDKDATVLFRSHNNIWAKGWFLQAAILRGRSRRSHRFSVAPPSDSSSTHYLSIAIRKRRFRRLRRRSSKPGGPL